MKRPSDKETLNEVVELVQDAVYSTCKAWDSMNQAERLVQERGEEYEDFEISGETIDSLAVSCVLPEDSFKLNREEILAAVFPEDEEEEEDPQATAGCWCGDNCDRGPGDPCPKDEDEGE